MVRRSASPLRLNPGPAAWRPKDAAADTSMSEASVADASNDAAAGPATEPPAVDAVSAAEPGVASSSASSAIEARGAADAAPADPHWDPARAAALWAELKPRRERGEDPDLAHLPPSLQAVLALSLPPARSDLAPTQATPQARHRLHLHFHRPAWVTRLGLRAAAWWADGLRTLNFLGEVALALARLVTGRSAMRVSDLMLQIDLTGPRSLPIVSLTSFLIGTILAYMGASQLQRFGAQIYIADVISVGVVREIAALMTGVILSGRVGAAFAAQLGTMQANEEVDALKAMGVNPIDYLVLPRLLAMLVVAPMLTAYAALVGALAGLLVAVGLYDVQPLEYLHKGLRSLTFAHVGVGLFKGTVYAALVALAGCRQGLAAGRSAQAVGLATTSAVVQALVWIVIAASALTVLLQRLKL